jgi:hypothetical protein
MATESQRARRRAQRETAKAVRARRTQLPPSVTRPTKVARENYIDYLRAHPEAIGPSDHKELARRASYAQWEQKKPGMHPNANPADLAEWAQFFYHKDR